MSNVVECVVSGDIFIRDLHPKPLERLRRELMYPNPEYRKSFITKQDPTDIPEWLDCMMEEPDGVRVPRGAVGAVRKVLKECGLEAKFIDERTVGIGSSDAIGSNDLSYLRDYQADALSSIVSKYQGIVVMPCGSGKTASAAAAISKIGRSAVVLVHTTDLLDQWVSVLQKTLGADIGTVADGKFDWKLITVAMVQTLAPYMATRVLSGTPEKTVTHELSKFGVCVIDECHRAPCSTIQKILPHIPAKWRIGLSATPDREDGLTKIMYWSIGEKIYEVEAPYLIKKGYLVPTEIRQINTDFEFEWDGPDRKKTAALAKSLTTDDNRNGIVVRTVAKAAEGGSTVLVLSNNKAHCKVLSKLLAEAGVDSVCLMGTKPKKTKGDESGQEICPTCKRPASGNDIRWTRKSRQKTLEQFRSGEVKVLLATSLADEALDIPRLEHVVLALPGASKRAVQQQLGRAMRPFENKKPVLYDFVDVNVESLVRRHKKRKSVYREMGFIS